MRVYSVREAIGKIGKDIYAARWAIIIIIAYFVVLRQFVYSLCPMVMVTGFPCPACGLTRAGFCLLRLDFAGAWSVHPFIYAILLLAVLFCLNRYILKGQPLDRVVYWAVIVTLAGMFVFYIWRMLTQFPGDPPMTYYAGNLISRFRNLFLSVANIPGP